MYVCGFTVEWTLLKDIGLYFLLAINKLVSKQVILLPLNW